MIKIKIKQSYLLINPSNLPGTISNRNCFVFEYKIEGSQKTDEPELRDALCCSLIHYFAREGSYAVAEVVKEFQEHLRLYEEQTFSCQVVELTRILHETVIFRDLKFCYQKKTGKKPGHYMRVEKLEPEFEYLLR